VGVKGVGWDEKKGAKRITGRPEEGERGEDGEESVRRGEKVRG